MQKTSIHSLPVSTMGGVPARQGFDLQDHIAARFCIRALRDDKLLEVWCEAFDDVSIVWEHNASQHVEFVQVKGHQLDQLWSIAKLCEQDSNSKAKTGTSIVERSLAQDRCEEKTWFRIVTALPFNDELKTLTFEIGSAERMAAQNELTAIAHKLVTKLKAPKSANGNGCDYWTESTVCEAVHSLDAVSAHNLQEMERTLELLGHHLMADQRQELYSKLVRKVWDAGKAPQGDQRKLKRHAVMEWLDQNVQQISQPPTMSGKRLEEKMLAANLPQDAVYAAQDSRWLYRQMQLRERYADPRGTQHVEGEINATLLALRSRLDVAEYQDDGPTFHRRCLDAIEAIYTSNPKARELGLGFVHGCMYNITDRCIHRFQRVTA